MVFRLNSGRRVWKLPVPFEITARCAIEYDDTVPVIRSSYAPQNHHHHILCVFWLFVKGVRLLWLLQKLKSNHHTQRTAIYPLPPRGALFLCLFVLIGAEGVGGPELLLQFTTRHARKQFWLNISLSVSPIVPAARRVHRPHSTSPKKMCIYVGCDTIKVLVVACGDVAARQSVKQSQQPIIITDRYRVKHD